MAEVLALLGGNPSSLHAEGRKARAILEDARARIAHCLGAEPDGVVFTSGGTEANHLALTLQRAPAHASSDRHRIASTIEHASLLEPLRQAVTAGGAVSLTGCTADGYIEPQEISDALRSETDWISIMLVNNETGVVQPIPEIAGIAHRAGAIMHTDAVQALGRLPLKLADLGVDAISLSAHKIGGPPGIGALIMQRDVTITPLLRGGAQEAGRRAGTENVAGADGFAMAIELALARQSAETQRLNVLRDHFEAACRSMMSNVHVNGAHDRRVPHTSNLSFDGCSGIALAAALDDAGYAVSVGSACHAGDRQPSHVLEAMCLTPGRCRGAVRFSFGYTTDRDAIERLLHDLAAIVRMGAEVNL